jgi:hypothetical protein
VTGYFVDAATFVKDMAAKGVKMQEVNDDGSLSQVRTRQCGQPPNGKLSQSMSNDSNKPDAPKDKQPVNGDDSKSSVAAAEEPAGDDHDNLKNSNDEGYNHEKTSFRTVASLEDIIARHPAHKKGRDDARRKEQGLATAAADVALLFDFGSDAERQQQMQDAEQLTEGLCALYVGSTYRDLVVHIIRGHETESLRTAIESHAAIIKIPNSFCRLLDDVKDVVPGAFQETEEFMNVMSWWICLLVVALTRETNIYVALTNSTST